MPEGKQQQNELWSDWMPKVLTYPAVGILASVHGSGGISMDDFDAVSRVIQNRFHRMLTFSSE